MGIHLYLQVSSVNRIPKPKPKIEKKPPKEEESANKEKTDSSESESKEAESTETSSESAAPEESQSEPQKTDDLEPEAHDELWLLAWTLAPRRICWDDTDTPRRHFVRGKILVAQIFSFVWRPKDEV